MKLLKDGLMLRDYFSFEGLDGQFIRFCFYTEYYVAAGSSVIIRIWTGKYMQDIV